MTAFQMPPDAPELFRSMMPPPATAPTEADRSPYLDMSEVASSAFNTPEHLAVAGELRAAEAAQSITRLLAPIRAQVATAAEAVRLAAIAEVGGAPAAARFLEVVPELRRAFDATAERIAAIRSAGEYSPEGKVAMSAQAKVQLAASVDALTTKAMAHAATFESAFPNPIWPAPTPDIVNECSLVIARFPLSSPAFFLTEAVDVLARAADPATDATARFRLNQQLKHAYLPLTERRAVAPERHARDLAPIAGAVRDLIADHLAAVQAPRVASALAKETALRLRTQWATARHTTLSAGKWDDAVMRIGAPLLYGAPTIPTE